MALPSKRRHRLGLAAAVSIAAIAVVTLLWGPIGFAIAVPIGLLGTAWYGDDKLGTCLPLAVMFLLAVTVLVALLGLTVLAFHT
jgi:hypothetical protein